MCLLGLSNSGKTLLFMQVCPYMAVYPLSHTLAPSQLVYGQDRQTQVSIKENKATYTPANKVVHVYILRSVIYILYIVCGGT